MVKRNTIGLLFSMSNSWIGGSYYFLNAIASFNNLPDERQPLLLIYSSDSSGYEAALKTGYPYLAYRNSIFRYSIVERTINKISRILLKRNIIVKGLPENEMPVLVGYYEQLIHHNCKRKIYWIPDFQEYYYPEFLGKHVALDRKKKHLELIRKNAELIFSSESSLRDFKSIYPSNNCKTSIVRFAVTHPDYSFVDNKKLLEKYQAGEVYFFTPNQFWRHKNHLIILKALVVLKRKNIFVQFLFSGFVNETDLYLKGLLDFIKENELEGNVIFLGFILREEQLCLMKNAVAIVQPSLFEGWSTVIEDAKAMGKCIVASDLSVHREQLSGNNPIFFNPIIEFELANILQTLIETKCQDEKNEYNENVISFATAFLKSTFN